MRSSGGAGVSDHVENGSSDGSCALLGARVSGEETPRWAGHFVHMLLDGLDLENQITLSYSE